MRTLRLLLIFCAILYSGAAQAQNFIYVAYQAIPGTNTGWPDVARLDYAARQRLSEAVQRDLLPAVVRTLRLERLSLETQIVPGGYMLKSDPSFVTRFPAGEEEAALQFAAALGYVLRQDSMLVFAVDPQRGDSLTVRVRVGSKCLELKSAHRFFVRAASIHKGLGGGYTAFGCEMLFINLRDEKGVPYSGLADAQFAAALQTATAGFSPPAVVAGELRTRTVLIGSDWPSSSAGKIYVDRLNALPLEAIVTLDLLAYRFGDLLSASVR